MKKPALIIQELSIYKIPGFPSGMESITSLASHINIIAGPNASGKSSTARIIQDMIWKQNIERIHVESRLAINEKKWDIKIDNGHYSSQCDGVDDTLTSLPAYDESKRYFLALHELIKEDDKGLAQEILRETIGGYDLQKAQQILGFKGTTPNLGLAEYKGYESNRKQVIDIENEQIGVQKEEKKLTILQEKYEEAKSSFHLKQLYEYLIDFLKAKKDYENLVIEKSSYPVEMHFLNGNENAELLKLESKIEENSQGINAILREKDSKGDELLALQIPEEGFDKMVLDELDENVDKLASLERNLESKRVVNTKSEGETQVALSRLFSTLKSENLEALDLDNVQDLDSFFEKAHSLLSKKQIHENEIRLLNKEKQKQNYTEEDLHTGIRLLLNWFQKDATASGSLPQSLWILWVLGLITVTLTYFFGWIGLIGVVAMLLYVLFKGRDTNSDPLRKTRVTDFKKTGLPEPTSWQEEEVSRRLEELHQELQVVKYQNSITRRLMELEDLLELIQPDFQILEAERQSWINKLSDIPELTIHNIESYSGLYWFLKNLQKWQKYNNELQANRLSYEEESKIYLESLAHINLILTDVHVAPASDTASAKAILKNMNDDENRRSALIRDIRNLEQRKVALKGLNENYEEEISSIYTKLKLEIGAKGEISDLLSKKEVYEHCVTEFEHASRRLTEKEKQLQDHAMYADIQKELPTLQIEEAEKRKERYAVLSNQVEALNTEIATIEAHISKEKTGHKLEVALTAKESALDHLEQNYLNTIGSITGDVIVNALKKRTQEHSKSKVFNRANELFNKITHGHYELILDDNEGGTFKAKDTVLNQGLPLDHLSSGTRIQLLIAVRLAFIESQELGIKLPILADEVLANSDDLRAKQIIEALIEISKEGRQVFYFTAQTDELQKWKEYIARHPEINGKIIVLKGRISEQLNYDQVVQTEMPTLSFTNVPSPGTYSNEEYHKLLSPPSYNLLKHTPEQLYLSYLIEDNELLHACLQRDIQRYGHLKSFVKYQGEIEGLEASTLKGIDRKVELLDFYQELFQKGRPKPIDREVLLDSDCVSNTFIDAVYNRLEELDYNPERLIESLRAGGVSRFSRGKIGEFEEYLFEKGYLDRDERLTPEDLNIQLHAALSRMEMSGMEAERFLKRVMN